jgi:hypothetical protein
VQTTVETVDMSPTLQAVVAVAQRKLAKPTLGTRRATAEQVQTQALLLAVQPCMSARAVAVGQ